MQEKNPHTAKKGRGEHAQSELVLPWSQELRILCGLYRWLTFGFLWWRVPILHGPLILDIDTDKNYVVVVPAVRSLHNLFYLVLLHYTQIKPCRWPRWWWKVENVHARYHYSGRIVLHLGVRNEADFHQLEEICERLLEHSWFGHALRHDDNDRCHYAWVRLQWNIASIFRPLDFNVHVREVLWLAAIVWESFALDPTTRAVIYWCSSPLGNHVFVHAWLRASNLNFGLRS